MKTGTRLFSILLALLLALSCGGTREAQAAVASCANGHNWSGWQGIGATCTEAGWQERFCYNCGTKERQTLPALGHSWNGGAVTAQPSCTSGGTRTYTCTRCGATRSEGIGALGHSYGGVQVTKPSTCATMGESFQVCSRCGDRITHVMPKNENHTWDEGVITKEPEGFTPGEKTYTCTLCGATRTEPVDPTGGVFSKLNSSLRNIPPSSGNTVADDLRIVTQPAGGFIPHGGFLELSVEAAGGEEPYDYEWWYEPDLLQLGKSASAIVQMGSALGQSITETIQQDRNNLKPATIVSSAEWVKSHGLESLASGVMEKNSAETLQMEAVPFNPMAKRIGSFTSPEINASNPGTYWCVVYDHNRQHVTSNRVEVKEGLYIAVQPESQNIWGLNSVTLTCRAGGGSGEYSYSWYGEDGIMGTVLEDGPSFTTNQPGTYVCYAVDFNTAEMVESDTVQVYSDEATQVDLYPVITLQPSDVMLDYREDGEYKVTFTCEAISPLTGDDANLDYEWEIYDTEGWRYAGITYKMLPFSKVQPGTTCRCKVVDRTTGKYVCSAPAKVRIKLAVAEIDVRYDISETQNGTGRCLLDARIVGGAPGYDIMVFRVTELETQYVGSDNEIHTSRVSYSNTLMSLHSDTGVLKNRFLQWGNCYYNHYENRDWEAMTKPGNDAVLRDLRLYQFYLRVRDSEGQEAVSEIVKVPAQGKSYDKYGGSDATITFDW